MNILGDIMEYSINDLMEKMFDEAYSLKIEELLKSDKTEIAEKINTMNEKIFNFGSQELIQDFEQLCNDIKITVLKQQKYIS